MGQRKRKEPCPRGRTAERCRTTPDFQVAQPGTLDLRNLTPLGCATPSPPQYPPARAKPTWPSPRDKCKPPHRDDDSERNRPPSEKKQRLQSAQYLTNWGLSNSLARMRVKIPTIKSLLQITIRRQSNELLLVTGKSSRAHEKAPSCARETAVMRTSQSVAAHHRKTATKPFPLHFTARLLHFSPPRHQ